MKDLLSKEHCSKKIHTILMKSSTPPLYRHLPPYMDYPHLFYKTVLAIAFYDFSKNSNPLINKGGDVHTMN